MSWTGPTNCRGIAERLAGRYLNNIVEQDHRAIKRHCAPMMAMKSFRTAAITLAGVEFSHHIRKSQFTFGSRGPHQFSSLEHGWARALMVLTESDRNYLTR